MPFIKAVAGGVELTIKVVPGASRSRIVGLLGDALKVQVAAPPEKGRANDAVIALVSAALGVPTQQLAIVRGHGRPRKTIRIRGIGPADARARLAIPSR